MKNKHQIWYVGYIISLLLILIIFLTDFSKMVFICLDYVFPAIVTGVIITVQPIILITVSNMLEKKM